MSRRALIVGINHYDHAGVNNLSGCVPDANAMREVLGRHEDNRPNYDCLILTSNTSRITRVNLRSALVELFAFDGDILFYFSGHGSLEETGGYLVSQDGEPGDPGIHMDEIIRLANGSRARSVLIIIDCCFSGNMGNVSANQGGQHAQAQLREGMTILAASRPSEPSMEVGGQGVFTELVVGALKGGAANVRGRVSAASIYGYVEAALGAWDQRPIYKSHAKQLDSVRECEPQILDDLLRKIPEFFPTSDHVHLLDPTFEEQNVHCAKPENVAIFKIFKQYQIAGLLKNRSGRDLYWTAEQSGGVYLTPLGEFYWRLASGGRI
ncbi:MULTISPECIES: caspase family protein [Rhizobium]|uniref:Peptidase C14 caspase domain-containing protein n=1 Tax=Rhizobium binae TaxID=1138190 RepID=A0ABV2MS61_9HYPH|nr:MULTISPECIES: caspase family protein [Rhizobium]NKL49283.1 caspase family protein [Rhizobium leguminosarum bv. viciae]MBX4938045.1 caspase family protein [Rhizobium binae]MBX4945182.1 caspase family protein [Rhizobium binae]MBX4980388.1 caspase family protein [Rhizobium binae]MBX4995792.1 caspase family protein [Rhizobium binae]